MSLRLGEFFDDETTGRRSTSKLGRIAGIACMCAGFLKVVWVAPPTEALAWLFGVFGGVLIVPELLKFWVGRRWASASTNGTDGSGRSGAAMQAKV